MKRETMVKNAKMERQQNQILKVLKEKFVNLEFNICQNYLSKRNQDIYIFTDKQNLRKFIAMRPAHSKC